MEVTVQVVAPVSVIDRGGYVEFMGEADDSDDFRPL